MRAALTSEGDAHTHAPDGASRRTASTAAGQAEAQRRHTHTRRAHVCTHKGVMAPRAERCVLSAVVPRPNRKRQPSCIEQPLRSHGSWPSCMSHGSWPSCIDQALRSHAVQAEQEARQRRRRVYSTSAAGPPTSRKDIIAARPAPEEKERRSTSTRVDHSQSTSAWLRATREGKSVCATMPQARSASTAAVCMASDGGLASIPMNARWR